MRIRYFAAARAAAEVGEEELDATTLAEALATVRAQHGERLVQVLDVCSFLVDGDPVGSRAHSTIELSASSVVDCLPPYAGG